MPARVSGPQVRAHVNLMGQNTRREAYDPRRRLLALSLLPPRTRYLFKLRYNYGPCVYTRPPPLYTPTHSHTPESDSLYARARTFRPSFSLSLSRRFSFMSHRCAHTFSSLARRPFRVCSPLFRSLLACFQWIGIEKERERNTRGNRTKLNES